MGGWDEDACLVLERCATIGAMRVMMLSLLGLLLVGCRALGSTVPVVKLGLLAPFEGRYRAVGYHLLPAARLAVSEAALTDVKLEWVILDTHGDPAQAVQRARELAVDPAVVAVIGPVLPESVAAVRPVLDGAGLPFWPLLPEDVPVLAEQPLLSSSPAGMVAALTEPPGEPWFYLDAAPPEAAFAASYQAASGTTPWPLDEAAYRATRAAIASEICQGRAACDAPDWQPSLTLYQGLTGHFPGSPLRAVAGGMQP
jgi:hypothetical protein